MVRKSRSVQKCKLVPKTLSRDQRALLVVLAAGRREPRLCLRQQRRRAPEAASTVMAAAAPRPTCCRQPPRHPNTRRRAPAAGTHALTASPRPAQGRLRAGPARTAARGSPQTRPPASSDARTHARTLATPPGSALAQARRPRGFRRAGTVDKLSLRRPSD